MSGWGSSGGSWGISEVWGDPWGSREGLKTLRDARVSGGGCGFQELSWGPSLWTHPPARRQPDAWGHTDSCPCHPPASEGPAGARAPGRQQGVTRAGPASFLGLPAPLLDQLWPYLQPLAHLHKRTDRVEGPCAAGQQVGVVVGMEQLHEVHALGLARRQAGSGTRRPPSGRWPEGVPSHQRCPHPFFFGASAQASTNVGDTDPGAPGDQPSPPTSPQEWVHGEAEACIVHCDSEAPKNNPTSPPP